MKYIHHLIIAVSLIAACNPKEVTEISVVPYPNEVSLNSGAFDAAGADIHYDAQLEEFAKDAVVSFAQQLSLTSGKQSKITEGTSGSGFNFQLNKELPKEAYMINVGRRSVTVEASSLNGVIYAIQTIKQMLPVEVFGSTAAPEADWTMQCCTINDAPRFSYRGAHLDVGRHFFTVEEVKDYLDILEFHKINTFHWHLTEDQGWRVEIKKYPKLTQIGAVRKETIVGHLNTSTKYDGTPYGEGLWYTQDQIREIVDYAARKGITVIPELDLPGHMLGALAAYPELGCTGGPYDVWCKWGVSEDVLCVGKESTMKFLEDVISEMCELFPSEYFHIGGDECPKVRWEKCPHCQAKIRELGLKDEGGHTAEQFLQSYVTARIEKFLAGKGKKIIGWDEILEGELSPNATVMSWRGVEGGLEAARMGHDAIMTPYHFCYLDYYQTGNHVDEPYLCIGGNLPVEKCYSYEPTTESMTPEEEAHILGVQANLWTEYIATTDHLYYQLLPRLTAISEVQWCRKENKDWERFSDKAGKFCNIFKTMGYNYAPHIFRITYGVSVNHESNCVETTLKAIGGTPIRYTLDGSEPEQDSQLFTGPISIEKPCTLKAKAFRSGNMTGEASIVFTDSKALGCTVKAIGKPIEEYTYNYPDNLVDGIRGKNDYGTGEWVGMHKEAFDVIIEVDADDTYSTVTLGTFIERTDDVFGPKKITVTASQNGNDYFPVAEQAYQPAGPTGPERCAADYTLTFPEISAGYFRIKAEPFMSIPAWHHHKGQSAYLFVDEVIIK